MKSSTPAKPPIRRAILWPHHLVFAFKHGRWLSACLLFVGMYTFFYLLQTITSVSSSAVPIFFCLVIAYIIPASHYINDQTVTAFDSLLPVLDLNSAEVARIRLSLLKVPVRTQLVVLIIGAVAGCMHDYLLLSTAGNLLDNLALQKMGDRVMMLVTIFIWILLTTAVSFLIRNVVIFARLAKGNITVNLLDTSALNSFARVSVYSTLLLVGALAGFPVLLLDSDPNYLTVIPGFFAITVPMIFIFLVPLLPIRKRIKEQKSLELISIQHEINQLVTTGEHLPANSEKLATLQPLLDYRREIKQVQEWSFDSTVMFRLAFYLFIPPLTWVGAALIERLVDAISF